jgi:hypothetical protein
VVIATNETFFASKLSTSLAKSGEGPQSSQNVRCFSPHCLHVYGTRTCPWAAETRFSAPHFAHLLSIRVLPRLIAMALRSIASFTKRSVSSRIACFDISRSLAFCKIGHRAGRRPRQRRCWGTIAHESVRNQPLGGVQPSPPTNQGRELSLEFSGGPSQPAASSAASAGRAGGSAIAKSTPEPFV